jgi:glycosyltransferase involved in cell wall biosynthesis
MNTRTTVLYPITDLARDGAQRQLLELVKGLDKQRFRPIVLTLRPGGPMEADFRAVPDLELISLERKGKTDLLFPFRMASMIRQIRADVVQPFLTPATFYTLLPALLCRTPVKIVTERVSAGRTATGSGYRLYLKMEDLLSQFADWAVSNSKAGEDFLIQRGINPNRVRVIYNGLDLSRLVTTRESVERVRQRLDIPPHGRVIGMMARLSSQKRHDTFLRAAAVINTVAPDTRYAIVGEGPLRGPLEKLSQELGMAAEVTFFGEQREVGPYVSAFDIAVLLSEAEGCSNSVLEAMALGKPVVATDVGGNRELVEHGTTGFLVPPGDVQAAAEAVLNLIRDTAAASSMGQKAREVIASRFSVGGMVEQYQALYDKTLAGKLQKGTEESRA